MNIVVLMYIWDKVFKNGPSKICGRQPLKKLKLYDLFLVSSDSGNLFLLVIWLCQDQLRDTG